MFHDFNKVIINFDFIIFIMMKNKNLPNLEFLYEQTYKENLFQDLIQANVGSHKICLLK